MVSIRGRASGAIAAILVLAASFLTGDDAAPAGELAPPLSSAPPRVPYTVAERLDGTLHDGDRMVKIPPYVDYTYFFGRVGDGWLGMQWPQHSKPGPGILQPDGTFRALGPDGSYSPTLSPDRKQVAVGYGLNGVRAAIVVDVTSGQEVSRTPDPSPGPGPTILAWNQTGVWFRTVVVAPQRLQLHVWEPGSGELRVVAVADFDGGLSAPSGTDVISVSTKAGNTRCLKAGSLQDGRFEVLREYCDKGTDTLWPVLSTDGKTMLHSELGLAIDVATGKVTKLRVGAPLKTFPQPVFEYASQVLVTTATQQVERCDVTTGECKVVLADATGVALQRP